MKKTPLISVITPCYNGENSMRPMLDSLLKQTYPKVEFFFINDGSTDHTEEIFLEYKPKLEQKGWKVIYHKQTNGGAAKALNFGLARFTGKYLTWPDSDDILYPNYLAYRVQFMEEHSDCDLMLHWTDRCVEKDYEHKITPNEQYLFSSNFFEKIMFHPPFAPGLVACARSSSLVDRLPERHIYDKGKGGQNWQLLLPLSYSGKVVCVNKILACYVVRENSHSHIKKNLIVRLNEYEEVLTHSLLSISIMPDQEKKKYLHKIKIFYLKKRIHIYVKTFITYLLGEKYFNKFKKFLNDYYNQ